MRKLSTVLGTIAVTGALFAAGCDSGTEEFGQDAEAQSQMGGQGGAQQQEGMPGQQPGGEQEQPGQQQPGEQQQPGQQPGQQQPGQQPPAGEQHDDPYGDDDYEDYEDHEGDDDDEEAGDPWQ